jgi:hypothetical protein
LLLMLLLMLRLMMLLLRHLLMLRMDLALTRLLPVRIRIRCRHGLLMLSQLSIIRRPSRRMFGLLASNGVVIRESLILSRSLLRSVAGLTMLLRDSLGGVSCGNSGRSARSTTSTCLEMRHTVLTRLRVAVCRLLWLGHDGILSRCLDKAHMNVLKLRYQIK